jgi:glycosyltransferase involved in cell wall biosynthesis
MFDYMAAGMAVVCPRFAVEVAPFVSESECGVLVETNDPDDIANHLDDLITHPEKIERMGTNGQQAVRDTYNWSAEAQRLIDMYREMESEK